MDDATSNKNLAALSVLHMAQKIVSRQKHNMLTLLHAACLKLLVMSSLLFFTDFSNTSFLIVPLLHSVGRYVVTAKVKVLKSDCTDVRDISEVT